jgi:hypothetical protein
MNCTCKFIKYGFEEAIIKDPKCPVHYREEIITTLSTRITALEQKLKALVDYFDTPSNWHDQEIRKIMSDLYPVKEAREYLLRINK